MTEPCLPRAQPRGQLVKSLYVSTGSLQVLGAFEHESEESEFDSLRPDPNRVLQAPVPLVVPVDQTRP